MVTMERIDSRRRIAVKARELYRENPNDTTYRLNLEYSLEQVEELLRAWWRQGCKEQNEPAPDVLDDIETKFIQEHRRKLATKRIMDNNPDVFHSDKSMKEVKERYEKMRTSTLTPLQLWRTGTKVGRTIYRDDKLVGVVDTADLADHLVYRANLRPLDYSIFGQLLYIQHCGEFDQIEEVFRKMVMKMNLGG